MIFKIEKENETEKSQHNFQDYVKKTQFIILGTYFPYLQGIG